MANGLGLAAAVNGFQSGFNFGKSIVGQDDASLDRDLKNKALAAEMALKDRAQNEEAIYHQGVLDAQRYQNLTGRLGVEAADRYHQGALANQDFNNRTQRIEANNLNDYRRNTTALARAELPSKINQNNAAAGLNNSVAAGHNFDLEQQKELELERKDEQAFMEDGGWHLPPERRQHIATKFETIANPAAPLAVKGIDQAMRDMPTKGDAAFTPEIRKVTGQALQPLLNQGVGKEDNNGMVTTGIEFDRFVPSNGGVKMQVRVTKASKETDPNGTPLKTKSHTAFITDGRMAEVDGGRATTFSPQMIHQVMAGLRGAGEFQALHPNLAQDMWDSQSAYAGAKTRADYIKNRMMIANARLQGQEKTAERAQKDADHAEKLRSALEKDAIDSLDNMAGFSAKNYTDENGKADTRAIQNIMKAREDTIAAIRKGLKNATPEQLMGLNGSEILNTTAIRPLLDTFRSSVVEPQSSVGPAPTRGGIQNPGYPAAGGQQRPFP